MPDFTLNAPGTTNNPWTPSNVIIPVSTLRSDATGFRAGVNGTDATFAHNARYGSIITTTVTLATVGSSFDDIIVGAAVRSGANAGAIIGVAFHSAECRTCTATGAGVVTSLSTATTFTRALGDVLSVTVSISGGVATITAKQNGTTLTFNVNTTSTYASESSLAAGAQFVPQNSDSLYLSQFTGTGIAVASVPSQFFLSAILPLAWVIGRRNKLSAETQMKRGIQNGDAAAAITTSKTIHRFR
jgi:hypothetical protein